MQDLSSFWTWYVLGHCHFGQRRYLEAAGDFAVCAARDPTFAWVHFNRGLALAKAGRLLDARDSYDRALEKEPKFREALVNRALVELELNQLERARDDLILAIKLGSRDLVVLVAFGETWARLGRPQEAERYFALVLEKDGGNLVVRIARGMTRVASDPRGAEDDFRSVLKRDERNAHAHYGMGLLIRKADPKKAIEHLDRAVDCRSQPDRRGSTSCTGPRAAWRARCTRRRRPPGRKCDRQPALQRGLRRGDSLENRGRPALCSSHAIDLLYQALKAGFPAREAAEDPDLEAIRSSRRWHDIMAGAGGTSSR